jgi:hypothetical protein
MKTNAPITATSAPSVAWPMIPLIESAARKLVAVANVNRSVHSTVYNTLIAEAALRC